jgi:FMN phosphatase YigB (HAD superfamily)
VPLPPRSASPPAAPGRAPIRAILLDALGTLLELEEPSPLLADAIRTDHGIIVDETVARRAVRAEIAHYRANNHRAGTAAALAQLRLECAEVVRGALGEAVSGIDAAALVPTLLGALRFRPFAEVASALTRWRADGLELAIASNWDISLHAVLAAGPLSGLIDVVVTSAEVGAVKPDPRLFEIALERLGVPARLALHVGDSYADDVVGARAAGIEPVLLAREGDSAPDAERARHAGVSVIAALDELAVH